MNGFDIVLLIGLALAVLFALRRMHKKRKSGCSCSCADCGKACPMAHGK